MPPCLGVVDAGLDQFVALKLNRVKRSIPAFAILVVMALVTAGVGFAIITGGPANAASATTSNTATIAKFIEPMKRASGTHFVLTYCLSGYSFLSSGTIVIAQIPSPPGRRARRMRTAIRVPADSPTSFAVPPAGSSSGSRTAPT